MIRTTVVIVVVLAAAGAVVGWFLLDDNDTDDRAPSGAEPEVSDDGGVEPMELEAHLDVVGDEVWVFGGLAGPDGSEHPVPSSVPENWEANDRIVMYGDDGSMRFHALVSADRDEGLQSAEVVADGDDRYLLTSTCRDDGCGGGAQPLLYRLEDNRAAEVPSSYVSADGGDVESVWPHDVVGTTDEGIAWVTATVEDQSIVEPLRRTALLAVELRSGRMTIVPLPDGVTAWGQVCAVGSDVFAMVPVRSESEFINRIELFRRPATAGPAEWSSFTQADIQDAEAWTVMMQCLESNEFLLVVNDLNAFEPIALSVSTADGTARPSRVPSIGSVVFVGQIDGRLIYAGREAATWAVLLYVREPDFTWAQVGPALDRDALPIVLDGQIHDAREAISRLDPDGVDLPVIDITD